MRGFSGFIAVLAFIVLIVSILFTCVQAVVMDRDFFEQEYYLMGTARTIGIDHDELMKVTDKLLSYIDGKEDSLKFQTIVKGKKVAAFDERERDHMVDVRALYMNFRTFRNVGAPVALAVLLLIALVLRKEVLRLFSKCYIIAAALFGGVFIAIIGWVAIDFYSFWNFFHTVFFSNDLWILDPATSLMINMFPLEFWFNMVMRIVTLFGIFAGGILLACIIFNAISAYRRRSLLIIRGKGK